MWNDWGDPFHLYPQLPFDPLLPSDAKFMGKTEIILSRIIPKYLSNLTSLLKIFLKFFACIFFRIRCWVSSYRERGRRSRERVL